MPEKTKHYVFWVILTLVVFASSLLLFVQIENFKRGEDLYSAESALNLVKNVFQKKSHSIGIKNYNNQTLGFLLSYPDKLTLTESGKEIVLEHRVPFKNTGECDFKGDGITYNFLTDFKATFQVFDGTVRQAVEKNSPYMPKENFSGDSLKISPGFIDEYRAGDLSGFAIYEGVEGCGHTIYYIPVADGKVLVATRNMVQILSGIFSDMREQELLKVPGVINNDENKAIFEQILQSFKLNSPSTSLGTTGDIAGWKTYRNEEYGFEIKYPKDWEVNEKAKVGSPDEIGISFEKPGKWGFAIYDYGNVTDTQYKNLSVLENAYNAKVYVFDPIQSINIDGQTTKLYIVKNPTDVEMGYPIDLTIRNGNKLLEIMGFLINTPNDKEEFIVLFKQILSTFKFIK